jgi:hypothetical protein
MTRFLVVAPQSLRSIVLLMEAVSTFETSATFYETTRLSNPEESNLHASPLEPVISLIVNPLRSLCHYCMKEALTAFTDCHSLFHRPHVLSQAIIETVVSSVLQTVFRHWKDNTL